MKIDYIANVRMPTEKAHGVQIVKMCEAWGANHEVALWAPTRINYLSGDAFEFYGVKKNFTVRKILSFDLLPFQNILGKAAFFAQNISFAVFASARVFFRKNDIIFSRDFWSAYFLSLLGKKVVYEVHDSPLRNFIVKNAFRKINKFVATNRFKADDLVNNFGVQREKILVAQNGVDFDAFNIGKSKEECRAALGLPAEKKIVLYSGHLYGWKGAATLLKAAFNLGNDILAVFVGGTEQDILRFRSAAGFRENILILGHKPHKEIPSYLGAADVLVLPNTAKEQISLSDTSPIKLFEYMASGRPIIASDIPSIREVAGENEVVFFKADDAADLAEKIKAVLSAGADEAKIESARRLAAIHSWSRRAEDISEFIAEH